MDEADIANDYAAKAVAHAVAKVRSGVQAGPGSEFCEWCEAEIPAARRQAAPGATLCVDCQAAKERLAGGAVMGELLDGVMRFWPVPFLVIQAVMAWVMWSLKQKFVCRVEYKEDQGKSEQRLRELERGFYAAPSRPEITALSARMEGLSEKISKLDGRLGGINRAVDLINEHLINKEK